MPITSYHSNPVPAAAYIAQLRDFVLVFQFGGAKELSEKSRGHIASSSEISRTENEANHRRRQERVRSGGRRSPGGNRPGNSLHLIPHESLQAKPNPTENRHNVRCLQT